MLRIHDGLSFAAVIAAASLAAAPALAADAPATAKPKPLLSFGAGDPQRVQRVPATRAVWEITVRYDNGQFGFVAQSGEPELKVGDRVRMFENMLEPIPQTPR